MEMWELFLKGLAKTIEEFTVKMIEKGKQEKGVSYGVHTRGTHFRPGQPVSQPKTPVQAQNVEKLQQSIKEVLELHPQGITMKNIAKELDVQWHFLRIPMRLLMAEEAIIKQGLNYMLPEPSSPKSDIHSGDKDLKPPIEKKRKPEEEFGSADKTEKIFQPDLDLESFSYTDERTDKTAPFKSTAPRRRVLDASQLEDKPKTISAPPSMSVRERESLRYRIMTALRGRPEGLYLEKIVEVLGEDADIVAPILNELQEELKILKQENGKFRLP
ncbi:MAG: hypothetical protein WBM02_03875 [bacterium]